VNAAGRLAAYATGLALVFAGSFATAAAVVPDGAASSAASPHGETQHAQTEHGDAETTAETVPPGLAAAAGGYLLSPVTAPDAVGVPGELAFRVSGPTGAPVVDYVTSHDVDLHLVVVRADGTGFRHVHPALDPASGTWTVPWSWDAAGTYRVFTDFTAAGETSGVTLTRTVDVAGAFTPAAPTTTSARTEVDGFTVTLDGDLVAGGEQELRATVTRDGRPVALQPYLGAAGHLVALRQGDLAYLHVHPGDDPEPGSATFAVQAPTAGRYLLHLDFQVEGRVHTAGFVLDATTEDHA
jgi:hypothetical protein